MAFVTLAVRSGRSKGRSKYAAENELCDSFWRSHEDFTKL